MGREPHNSGNIRTPAHHEAPHLSTHTVSGLLLAKAAADGASTAFVVDGIDSLTYAQWARRSDLIARGLAQVGISHGDRVAIMADSHQLLDFACAFVAVAQLGAVSVPIAGSLGAELRSGELAQSAATAVITCGDLVPPVGLPMPLSVDRLEELGACFARVSVNVSPGDVGQIIFTSGTTGVPRGIAAVHADLTSTCQPSPRDRPPHAYVLQCVPVATNAHQVMVMSALSLQNNMTTVVLSDFEPDDYCRLVETYRIAGLQLVPAMARWLLQAGRPNTYDLTSVLWIGLSTAPSTVDLLSGLGKLFPNAEIANIYTSTEAHPTCVAMTFDPTRPLALGLAGDRVQIIDDEGQQVAAGETGEVLLAASPQRRSYIADAEATARVFLPGWTRTGDLGYVDDDGYLYVVDRKSDSINIGGIKVSSLEVEAVLESHAGVLEVAVVGVPHALLGSQLVAAVVLGPEGLDESSLRRYAVEHLGWQKAPQRFVRLSHLPRNVNNKVLKTELRRQLADIPPEPFIPPRGELETDIARTWQEVLGCGEVSATANFFDLGGHSLAAARVTALLSERYERPVHVRAIFEAPTVTALAAQLASPSLPAPTQPDPVGVDECRPDDGPITSSVGAMTFAQWAGEQTAPGSTNLFASWHFRGSCDRRALAAAAAELLRRHDAFRTVIAPDDDLVLRPFLRGVDEIRLEEINLQQGSAGGNRLPGALIRAVREPFDLSRAPLVRVIVAAADEGSELVLLLFPHVVADDWSVGLLHEEFPALYTAALEEKPFPPSPPGAQHSDFLRWEQSRMLSEAGQSDRQFWDTTLIGCPLTVQLPLVDHSLSESCTGVQNHWGDDAVIHVLSDRLVAALRAIAAYHQASLFMVLLAAFTIQLHRLHGQNDVIVPTLVSGRTRPQFDRTVGYLARALVLRTDLTGVATFLDVLMRTRHGMVEALDHYVSAAEPATELAREAHAEGLPLTWGLEFQSLVAPMSPGRFGGLEPAGSWPADRRPDASTADPSTKKRDLAPRADRAQANALVNGTWAGWRVVDRGDQVALSIHGVFDGDALRRALAGFERLLEAVASDPSSRVASLPVMSAEDRSLLTAMVEPGMDAHTTAHAVDEDSWRSVSALTAWCLHRSVTSLDCSVDQLLALFKTHTEDDPPEGEPLHLVVRGPHVMDAGTLNALRACRHVRVSQQWGPEAGKPWTAVHLSSLAHGRPVVGQPIAGSGIAVTDSYGQLAAIGSRGALTRHGAPTGYAARVLPDGNIELMGRESDWIVHRGYDIDTRPLRTALMEHPCVEDAYVALLRDGEGHPRLTAVVVADPLPSLTALQNHIRAVLPAYPPPVRAIAVPHIPRREDGSADTTAIETGGAQVLRRAAVGKRSAAEIVLCNLLEGAVGREVSVHENVLSLVMENPRPAAAAELCLRAQAIGLPLHTRDLLLMPSMTVRDVAARFSANT